jgi:hypothetical protein
MALAFIRVLLIRVYTFFPSEALEKIGTLGTQGNLKPETLKLRGTETYFRRSSS